MDGPHSVGIKSSGKKTEVPEEEEITSRYLWTQGTAPALLWVSNLRPALQRADWPAPRIVWAKSYLPTYLDRQTDRQTDIDMHPVGSVSLEIPDWDRLLGPACKLLQKGSKGFPRDVISQQNNLEGTTLWTTVSPPGHEHGMSFHIDFGLHKFV